MIVFNNTQSDLAIDVGKWISISPQTMCNLSRIATDEQIKQSKRLGSAITAGYLVVMQPDAQVFRVNETLARFKKSGHAAAYISASKQKVDTTTKSLTRREISKPVVTIAPDTAKRDITGAMEQMRATPSVIPPVFASCKGLSNSGQPCKRKPLVGYEYCLIHLPDDQRKLYEKQRGPTFSSILKQ